MRPQNRRLFRLEDVESYMLRYLPRLTELGQTTPNIVKNVTRDCQAARWLMEQMK